jgi:hypothetical protein
MIQNPEIDQKWLKSVFLDNLVCISSDENIGF